MGDTSSTASEPVTPRRGNGDSTSASTPRSASGNGPLTARPTSASATPVAPATPERTRGGYASPRTEEKVPRGVASASAKTEKPDFDPTGPPPPEPPPPKMGLIFFGHAYNLRHLLHVRQFKPLLLEAFAAHWAARRLCRAWRRTLEIRGALVESGKLAVILVANLGKGGDCPSAEVQQKHIHTTVRHAGQRATFLIANEYDWGSHKMGEEGPGGTDKRVQTELGFKLTTEEAACERCSEMRCKCGSSSCWRYAQETKVFNGSHVPSIPGVEGGDKGPPFNIIATRQAGAFVLEKMPIEFYRRLPNEAYGGRFLCAKATHRDKPGHSFLLATWHGKYKNVTDAARVEVVKKLCAHLCHWCGNALCCLFAGDFNVVLQPTEALGGFVRLDPDEKVGSQWAGRRRNGNRQNDIDHMLFYQPEGSPLTARRPRRFRMYDRQRAGLLPRRRACADAGHCSCSQEATPPDQACAGAVTHEHDGALDHDGLILELWLDDRAPAPAPEAPSPSPAPLPAPGQLTDPMRGALAAAGEAGQAADEATFEQLLRNTADPLPILKAPGEWQGPRAGNYLAGGRPAANGVPVHPNWLRRAAAAQQEEPPPDWATHLEWPALGDAGAPEAVPALSPALSPAPLPTALPATAPTPAPAPTQEAAPGGAAAAASHAPAAPASTASATSSAVAAGAGAGAGAASGEGEGNGTADGAAESRAAAAAAAGSAATPTPTSTPAASTAAVERAVADADPAALVALFRACAIGARTPVASGIAILADAPPGQSTDPMRGALAAAGALPPLVTMLINGTAEERAAAAEALSKLARNAAITAAIVAADALKPLVALVRDGDARGKANAASALANLAAGDAAIRAAIKAAGALEPLVALVRDGDVQGKAHAARALANLANGDAAIHAVIVAAGALEPLVALVRDGDARGKAKAAGALQNLANGETATKAAIVAAGALEALEALVRDGDAQGKAKAAGALWMISYGI
jgi:hypothetical protein